MPSNVFVIIDNIQLIVRWISSLRGTESWTLLVMLNERPVAWGILFLRSPRISVAFVSGNANYIMGWAIQSSVYQGCIRKLDD